MCRERRGPRCRLEGRGPARAKASEASPRRSRDDSSQPGRTWVRLGARRPSHCLLRLQVERGSGGRCSDSPPDRIQGLDDEQGDRFWPVEANWDRSSPCLAPRAADVCAAGTVAKKFYRVKPGIPDEEISRTEADELEQAAVWSPNHIEDRLRDHFAGVPNQWVEIMRARSWLDRKH